MKRLIRGVLFFIIIAGLKGCGTKVEECVYIPDTSQLSVPFEFHALEDSINDITTKDQLVHFFSRHSVMRDYLFGRNEYPNDSVFINDVFSRITHPGFDTLLFETRRIFGDLSELKEQFHQAFNNITYYYPDFVPPKVETVISGLASDLVVTDTLIIVGLDYYLGKEGRYRPRQYDYILTRYEPEDIVPSALLIYGISERFNKTSLEDRTVLADMIAYGKSFYFARHMLPCVADSVFIWYTEEEMRGSRNNQDLIWARFIEDQVLFSTSNLIKQKYLGERPKTLEVGEKCPGRIGQWVGWEIVKKYMQTHPQTTLPQLMEMSDAQQLFRESKYKPERR